MGEHSEAWERAHRRICQLTHPADMGEWVRFFAEELDAAAEGGRAPQDEEAAEVCHYPTTHTPGCGCGALRRDEVYPVPVKPSPGPDDPVWDRLNTPGADG